MISDKDIKTFLKTDVVIPQSVGLLILGRYIEEHKNIKIKINPPDNLIDMQLYGAMLNKALDYYTLKLGE